MSDIEFKFRPMSKWPRTQTPGDMRKSRPFKTAFDKTLRLLKNELRRLNAENPVVIQIAFKDAEIRLDGMPRSDASPKFPGIILSFRAANIGPLEYSCDACRNWTDNVHAIVLTLERLRMIEIYGCTKRNQQYTGWKALSPMIVTPPPMSVEEAAEFMTSSKSPSLLKLMLADRETMQKTYRAMAAKLHPDANNGRQDERWNKLQQAKEVIERHMQSS